MDARIFGMLCTRNESHRYLTETLRHHSQFLDGIFVWDDRSDDDTTEIARRYAQVEVRPKWIHGFVSDESKFRQTGWTAMAATLDPRPGIDWIFAFDADEFFVADDQPERQALEWLVTAANSNDRSVALLRIDEIFAVDERGPQRRIDGFWGGITAARFVRYTPEARFTFKPLGGGSVPVLDGWPHLVRREQYDATAQSFAIRHYGYTRPEDRQEKYARYRTLPGHNPRHVESILQHPTLEPLA